MQQWKRDRSKQTVGIQKSSFSFQAGDSLSLQLKYNHLSTSIYLFLVCDNNSDLRKIRVITLSPIKDVIILYVYIHLFIFILYTLYKHAIVGYRKLYSNISINGRERNLLTAISCGFCLSGEPNFQVLQTSVTLPPVQCLAQVLYPCPWD